MDATRRVELPDGRLLAFRGDQVVGFNLIEAQRHASRGTRTRLKAMEELYRRDDGMWGIGDPSTEIDLFSDLAAAVLFSFAAVDGLGDPPLAPAQSSCGSGDSATDSWARGPVPATRRSSDVCWLAKQIPAPTTRSPT